MRGSAMSGSPRPLGPWYRPGRRAAGGDGGARARRVDRPPEPARTRSPRSRSSSNSGCRSQGSSSAGHQRVSDVAAHRARGGGFGTPRRPHRLLVGERLPGQHGGRRDRGRGPGPGRYRGGAGHVSRRRVTSTGTRAASGTSRVDRAGPHPVAAVAPGRRIDPVPASVMPPCRPIDAVGGEDGPLPTGMATGSCGQVAGDPGARGHASGGSLLIGPGAPPGRGGIRHVGGADRWNRASQRAPGRGGRRGRGGGGEPSGGREPRVQRRCRVRVGRPSRWRRARPAAGRR